MWLLGTHDVRNVEFSPGKTHPSLRAGKSDSVVTLKKPLLDRWEGGHNQHSSPGLICCCSSDDPRIHLSNITTCSPKSCSWNRVSGSNSASPTFTTEANTQAETLHFQKLPGITFPQPPHHWGIIQGLVYWRIKNIPKKRLNQAHILFTDAYREDSTIWFLFAPFPEDPSVTVSVLSPRQLEDTECRWEKSKALR